MIYDFNQHRHNYAVWTAARAAQRGFASTARIKYAIEKSGLRAFVETDATTDEKSFAEFHRNCANKIMDTFNSSSEIESGKTASYGRAAKIIAIYLKTSLVLVKEAADDRSGVIHPPIDNILLTNLSKKKAIKGLEKVRWTKLDEKGYWELVDKIKNVITRFDWTLEEYWSPEMEDVLPDGA